jgi:putative transposase
LELERTLKSEPAVPIQGGARPILIGVSIRRACALISVARSTLDYESRLVKRDAPVVPVMQELAAQYPRYGHRCIQVFLERRGHRMSADRAHRL